jgi:DNA-binding MarR family transcriptional regulator
MPVRPLPAGLRPGRRVALANRLNTAAIHLLRRIGQDDGAEDVTGARLSALSVLVYGGPGTMGALAGRERVAAPTMSRIVDALVRDGLATRAAEPGDRRSVRLEATAAGRRLMERGRSRRIRRLTAELDGLAEREIRALEDAVAVLERLGSDLNRAGAPPRPGRGRGKR